MIGSFWDKLKSGFNSLLGGNKNLCSSCKWNWRSACHNPERPNATKCHDYEKRGT
ncbi:MAG: hypothetical protein IZT57_02810 [Chloroflexi bacterium]|nr:hypothetical protein [Chloroflexota bacterium]